MAKSADPRAARIAKRKSRKAERAILRAIVRTEGIASAARFYLRGPLNLLTAIAESEDCHRCQSLNRAAIAC